MATGSAATMKGAAPPAYRSARLIAAGLLAAIIGAFIFPPGAFTIDEAIYVDMAHAMATRGTLDITPPNLPEGAPVLVKSDGLVRLINDRAIPQYPSLYAVMVAPLYALFGVRGLILMNALSSVLCLWLVYRLARAMDGDVWTARTATMLFGAASVFAGYVFAIWPHMTALVFVLGGAAATASAGKGRRPALAAGLAGLLFGIGVGVRVDVILSAVAAFFWLRLFARCGDRLAALALSLGLLPGLIASAFLNYGKFGVFNPFSYGTQSGGAALSKYALIICLFAVGAALAFVIDVSRRPWAAAPRAFVKSNVAVKAGLIALTLTAAWLVMPSLIHGLYVLIVNLQAYDGAERAGEIRDAYGYWIFWGLPKKALLQSAPYLPLAMLPVLAFLNGDRTVRTSFLLLFAAAPIMFFSLYSWHGGMAYNLRYFLPAIPFLVILATLGLQRLKPAYDAHPRLFIRSAIAGLFLSVLTYSSAPFYPEALQTPARLYPQLVLAAALLTALTAFLNVKRQLIGRAQFAAAGLAAAAIGVAFHLSIADAFGYAGRRMAMAEYDRAYQRAIPQGSLVISAAEDMLTGPSRAGSAIVSPDPDILDRINAAVDAYEEAGRCVYVHTSIAAAIFGVTDHFVFIDIPEAAGENDLPLYGLKSSPAHCRAVGDA